MKNPTPKILFLMVGCFAACAQTDQFVTVTAVPTSPASNATNSYTITAAQAAEVISLQSPSFATLSISKDGTNFPYYRSADNNAGARGTVIQGPATFTLQAQSSTPAYLTLKLMPEAFPPNSTLILAPGTNQFQITLQTSTNLVDWSDTTNGVYGGPDSARFFRISLVKLP